MDKFLSSPRPGSYKLSVILNTNLFCTWERAAQESDVIYSDVTKLTEGSGGLKNDSEDLVSSTNYHLCLMSLVSMITRVPPYRCLSQAFLEEYF